MRIDLDLIPGSDDEGARLVDVPAGKPEPLVVAYLCQRCGRQLPETIGQGVVTIGLRCKFCGTDHRARVSSTSG